MADPKDGELVLRARSGDKEAYGELVSRYQGHVYGLAYSFVNSWAEAQDIAQETFIRAYANLDQLRDPSRFAAWLRRVTFGVAMNWLKAFRRGFFEQLEGRVDLDHLEIPEFTPGPPEVVGSRELAVAVLQAVDSLPSKYRVPLTMFHLDGLSYKKVADFLDIPLGTVKMLIHRARAKLKAALAAYVAEEISPMVQEVFNQHKLSEEFAQKILEGVPTLRWGRGKDCTFAGALEAATAVTDHPYSYSDLMGFSGLAFRVRWHEQWCPSCTVGEMEEEITAVSKATGWKLRVKLGDGGPDMERFTGEIVGDVNAGRPVLVYPPDLNVAVAFGYEDAGKTLLLRDYMKREDTAKLATGKLGFLLMFLGEHRNGMPLKDAVVASLRIALHNWRRGIGNEGPGDYWYGEAAFKRWMEDLSRTEELDDGEQRKLFFVGWLNFNTVADARKTAVTFLREHASLFDGAARKALERVAAIYDEEGKVMGGVYGAKDAFLGGWSRKSFDDWTPDVREREREILADLSSRDAAAIAEIEKALQAISN